MKKKYWLIGISIIAISIFAYRTHTQREIERELARISNAKYAAEEAVRQAYYKVSFAPQSCKNKNEQGNVFIAIGDQVFRVKWEDRPSDDFIYRIPKKVSNSKLKANDLLNKLIPIDSSKLEGCYENPIKAEWFSYKFSSDPHKNFVLHGSQYYKASKRHIKEWNRLPLQNNTICGNEDEIFSSCRHFSPEPKNKNEPPSKEYIAIYKADEKKYRTPDGSPFLIYCDFGGGQICEITYEILNGVELRNGFIRHIPTSDRRDNSSPYTQSVSSSIANDIEIRKVVNQLHIKTYPWVRSTPLKN